MFKVRSLYHLICNEIFCVLRYAYVEFESVDEAATFNENCQGVLDIGDITVIVEYAKNPPVKSSFSCKLN